MVITDRNSLARTNALLELISNQLLLLSMQQQPRNFRDPNDESESSMKLHDVEELIKAERNDLEIIEP